MKRKLVEGLYLSDINKIQRALKALLETSDRGIEDYLIIVLYEALSKGYLEACSKTAAIISGLILEANPHREMLLAIADGINDSVVNEDPAWLDSVVFEDVDIPVEARYTFWSGLDRVKEVRKLFAQAPYSSAVDERCTPTPAEPYYTSGHVDSYGYAHLDSTPTIDDLCDDEPESEPPKHYRPDPVPSDWKEDDTCSNKASTNTSASTSQAESTTDKWPEDTTGDYFVDGDNVNYF